jgi:hypothetical protein
MRMRNILIGSLAIIFFLCVGCSTERLYTGKRIAFPMNVRTVSLKDSSKIFLVTTASIKSDKENNNLILKVRNGPSRIIPKEQVDKIYGKNTRMWLAINISILLLTILSGI